MIDKTFIAIGLMGMVIYAVLAIGLHMQKREGIFTPDKKEVLSAHGVGVFSVVVLSLAFPISWALRAALFAVLVILIVVMIVLETNDNLTQAKLRFFSKKSIGIFSIALIFCLSLFVFHTYQANATALHLEAQRIAINNAKHQAEQQALYAAKLKNSKAANKPTTKNKQALVSTRPTATYESPPSFFKTYAPTFAVVIGAMSLLQLIYLVMFIGDKGRVTLWWSAWILNLSTALIALWSATIASDNALIINTLTLLLCIGGCVVLWAYKNTYSNELESVGYQNYEVEHPPLVVPAPQPTYKPQRAIEKEIVTAVISSSITPTQAIESPPALEIETAHVETVRVHHAGVEAVKKRALQKMQLRSLEAELEALKETANLLWQAIRLNPASSTDASRAQQMTRHEQTLLQIENIHNKILMIKREMTA